jgi:hypothetical protein
VSSLSTSTGFTTELGGFYRSLAARVTKPISCHQLHSVGVLLREIVQLGSADVEKISVKISLQDACMPRAHKRPDQHLPEKG